MKTISIHLKPIKSRNIWSINPVTRTKVTKKFYSRKKINLVY
jgi:hypothetical protein